MKRYVSYWLTKRFVLIALAGLIAVVCVAQFGGGDGSENNPFRIDRAEHLNEIRGEYLAAGYCFIQTANIDLGREPWNTGQGWTPIGDNTIRFQGKYDGNGFTVDGLFISRNTALQGLFGVLDGAVICNLGVTDVSITGQAYTGAIAARAINGTVISNCFGSGNVIGNGNQTGGLVGHNQGNSTVTDCYSECDVRGGNWYTGGVVGLNDVNSTVNNCFGTGTITGNNQIGGIVGQCQINSRITNCYATGAMSGVIYIGGVSGTLIEESSMNNCYSTAVITGGNNAGGLIGFIRASSVENCYSMGRVTGDGTTGGMIAYETGNPEITESYWNTETSGQENSPGGGAGRLTRQMVYPYDNETYIRWDFDEIWDNDVDASINNGYPILRFQTGEQGEPLETPKLEVDIVKIEGEDHFRIRWELIEGALSYKVYASNIPITTNWGDPVRIVGEDVTIYTEAVGENIKRFFFIKASSRGI